MKWKIKIPNSLSLRKLLYNKRFTIPFSLIAAFIFWLIIMINQNPDADRTFTDVPVTINLENTFAAENGMEIIGDISSQKFTVTIKGPRYVVSALQSDDIYVYASAAAINAPGEYQLEVPDIPSYGRECQLYACRYGFRNGVSFGLYSRETGVYPQQACRVDLEPD